MKVIAFLEPPRADVTCRQAVRQVDKTLRHAVCGGAVAPFQTKPGRITGIALRNDVELV
jgi:hypothetical protein